MTTLYNRLLISSDVEKRLTSCVEAKKKWMKEARNLENEEGLRYVCGVHVLIASENVKMCALEKLIYKAISDNIKELLPKYKEKYVNFTRQSLEYWELLTEAGVENDGDYLEQANALKENYDYIEWAASALD
jgi:hypothetical protein